MENLNDFVINNLDIKIGKKYIKILEDFDKILVEENIPLISAQQATIHVKTLSIVKNYLINLEISKIFCKYKINFESLISLNLTANDLTEIPQEIKFFTNLENLILNNNKIKKLENLAELKFLKRLEMRSNRIREFENLDELENLKLITLSCNLIDKLDNDKIKIRFLKLEELGLFGNYMGDLNCSEKNLKQLEELLILLSNKMPNLRSLYLGGNHFSKVENLKEIVKFRLNNLEKLDGNLISI